MKAAGRAGRVKAIFSAGKVTRFICVTCSFTEEWGESREDLAKLVDKYRT